MIDKYQRFLDIKFQQMGVDMNRADKLLMDEFDEVSPFLATSLISEWLRNKAVDMHGRIVNAANIDLRSMGHPQFDRSVFVYGSLMRPLSPVWFTPKVDDVALKYWTEYLIVPTDWKEDRQYIRLPSGRGVHGWLITTRMLSKQFCEHHDLAIL